MATKTKLSLAFFLFLFLALFSNLALGKKTEEPELELEDPELITCKHQCQQQSQYTEEDTSLCLERCDEYHRMKQEREKRIHHEREEEETREKKEEQEEEQDQNPYVFDQDNDFETTVQTEAGRIRVLNKFTHKSKLLRGIQNYRLAILEAKAHTFVSPRHFDSDVVLFNIKGRAVLGLVRESETEKFIIEAGDMIPIPAGTPLYIVNRDENEKLFLAMLHIPVSTPGSFEEFYGPGGRDPESVLSAFSWNVLQAALKSPKRKLERLFDQQNEGSIFQISKEQLKAMLPKERFWLPFSGPSKAQFNLYNKRPTFSNKYGRLTEVTPDDEKSGLQRLNLMLTFANISKRSMSTILYNSHATKIALVIEGSGQLQIACPHMSSESEHDKSSPSYQRMSADLKPGMVFVVPTGHPFVTIASHKENLLMICFEVNARQNTKFTYAGKDNIVSSLDDVVKELAFNSPSALVNEVFGREESFFFPFELPRQQQHDRHDRRADA